MCIYYIDNIIIMILRDEANGTFEWKLYSFQERESRGED